MNIEPVCLMQPRQEGESILAAIDLTSTPALISGGGRLAQEERRKEVESRVKMRAPAPSLRFSLVDGGTWSLSEQSPESLTVVVFYRGLHCSLCRMYLSEFEGWLDEFEAAGASVVAVSADDSRRAKQAKSEWELERLRVGYGLGTDVARDWGLFVSRSAREGEPAEFFEPGLFLIKPNGTLFYAAITSSSWGRPPVDHVLFGIKIAARRGSLARGEA